MQQFIDNISRIQPQLISLLIVTLILVVLAIVVHQKVKKATVQQAPKGVLFLAEQYVMGVDSLFKSIARNTISPAAPYIFTLLSFLLVGNLIGLIGFDAPVTSYSVPMVLGLISWIGIYVVGITYQRFHFFAKFKNPVEIVSQISPFISISFRIFGNIIGGSTIMYLIYHVTGLLWAYIPIIGEVNLLGSLIAPPFHLYFDLFSGIIQAFVFTLLTSVYWAVEADSGKQIEGEKTKKITVFQQEYGGPHRVRTS